MSLPATIKNLPGPKTKDDSNILEIKSRGVFFQKNQNILESLAFMRTFDEISQWVLINSNGFKFIANPINASDIDRDNCLTAVQLPIVLTLQNIEKRRKNGRDKRLIEANKAGNYALIADILASSAASYWRDHGFLNSSKDLKIAAFLKNNEQNFEKKDFQKAQLDHIGAAVEFTKAQKKGAFQECLDFLETEEILKYNDLED